MFKISFNSFKEEVVNYLFFIQIVLITLLEVFKRKITWKVGINQIKVFYVLLVERNI